MIVPNTSRLSIVLSVVQQCPNTGIAGTNLAHPQVQTNRAALSRNASRTVLIAFHFRHTSRGPIESVLWAEMPRRKKGAALEIHKDQIFHAADGAESTPALNSHDDGEPNVELSEIHAKWAKLGYYEYHPNHNPANASEIQLKTILQSHEKLSSILKEYKLLLNHSKKRTLLLQYPNRDFGQEYRAATGQKPLELRIKPKCGLVELDIPLNIHANFDKEKGIEYGGALRSSRLVQQGGSYGLSGGFGVGPRPITEDRKDLPPDGPSPEKLLEKFDDSNNKGHVMNKITLGGRIVPFKDGDPIYMTATFRGGQYRCCKPNYAL